MNHIRSMPYYFAPSRLKLVYRRIYTPKLIQTRLIGALLYFKATHEFIEIYFDNVRSDEKFGWGTEDGLKITTFPHSEKIKVFNTK